MSECCVCQLIADIQSNTQIDDYLSRVFLPFLNSTCALLRSFAETRTKDTVKTDEERKPAKDDKSHESGAEETATDGLRGRENTLVDEVANNVKVKTDKLRGLECVVLDRKELTFRGEPILVLLCKSAKETFRVVLKDGLSVALNADGFEQRLGELKMGDEMVLTDYTMGVQREAKDLQTVKVTQLKVVRQPNETETETETAGKVRRPLIGTKRRGGVQFPKREDVSKKKKVMSPIDVISDPSPASGLVCCSQCREWNEHLSAHVSCPEARQSRHKFARPIHGTPRGYWDVNFPPTQMGKPSRLQSDSCET